MKIQYYIITAMTILLAIGLTPMFNKLDYSKGITTEQWDSKWSQLRSTLLTKDFGTYDTKQVTVTVISGHDYRALIPGPNITDYTQEKMLIGLLPRWIYNQLTVLETGSIDPANPQNYTILYAAAQSEAKRSPN